MLRGRWTLGIQEPLGLWVLHFTEGSFEVILPMKTISLISSSILQSTNAILLIFLSELV